MVRYFHANPRISGPGVEGGVVAEQARGAVEHNPGKPMSWISVTVITIGFIVGGAAMVPHPTWWLFWLGAGIAVVGCLMVAFARTFNDDWY
jgi:hypothetical protein